MTRAQATATGFVAVLLWALLAVLTVGTAPMPPLLLTSVTFAIGGGLGLIWLGVTHSWGDLRRVPLRVYLFGTAGLFGYHFLYFSALRLAPPAEASLIAYLWPLFIVLFSGLLPGERLTGGHIAGAFLAFAGAALILGRGTGGDLPPGAMTGLGLAFLCALTWSSYSVGSRLVGHAPTASVAVFCVATAILSAIAHVMTEPTVWPASAWGWASCVALGIGPVGLAFYVWDIGVKRGNIQLLGVASYAAPLLSTLVLIGAGQAAATPRIAMSALLITLGAALAARAGARKSPAQT
ncbi:DMT family transporter [Albidovulum sediminicola]|uniref:EamA family transporter n=1 Tax=Albidovulum sediminicola TaxID=2984331 RepID=A0ABT2YYE2_9RHOB|nr:EamA family transporter [Defluviimonas sp. WL0075]MCV2863894.1 EamA family transporter [Defluviimonas sp. WL0075]